MTDLFQTVLNMSITGAYIAAAIIILRLSFKKLPKKYSYALWLILGIRLLCPVSFSSAVSMFNIVKPETTDNQMTYISQDYKYVPSSETMPVTQTVDAPATKNTAADKKAAVNMKDILSVCSQIWIAGVCIMTAYSAVTYILVHKKVSRSEHLQDNVYICKNISSPFVYGIVKPKIYLSSNIPADEVDYILAHEKAHIKRGDHIVKIIALAALSVHWFNPLVWVSYKLMVWDMELSCDDIALRTFEQDVRKEYANTLLNMSLRQNNLSLGGILAFGETNIKSRVKSVLSSKKPKAIAIVFAVVIVITAAVCLLTNAKSRPDEKLINISDFESFGICEYTDYAGYSDVKPITPDKIIDFINSCEYTAIEDETAVELLGATSYSLRMYYGPDCDGEYKNLSIYSPAEQQNPNCFIISDNVSGRKFYQLSEMQFAELALMFTENFDGTAVSENEAATVSEELPREYLSLCGDYLTDLWNDVADKRELDINKYTSDSDMIRLFETISENSKAEAAPTEFDRLETVFGSDNVSYGTADDKTWIHINYYEVLWWSGDEITQRKEGYDAYFELTEINGRTEIAREYELWQLVPVMGLDRSALTYPLDIDISDVISHYENNTSYSTKSCEAIIGVGERTENGVEFTAETEGIKVKADFSLPDNWDFNGYSVADCNGAKVFEIGAAWSAEQGYSVPEITDGYYIENALGRKVTVLDEQFGTDGLYEYMLHSSVPDFYSDDGIYESYNYIVKRDDFYISVIFVVNEDFNENVCSEVLRSLRLTPTENLAAPTNSHDMTENDWELKLYAEKTELNEGEPLNVYTELKYIGEQDEVKVYGSFNCVLFSLEGDRYFTDGQGAEAVPAILEEHTIRSGDVIRRDYIPTACWSADAPDSDFYEQYIKADKVILPVGKYTLTAYIDFASDENFDNRIFVRTSVDVTVHDAEARYSQNI